MNGQGRAARGAAWCVAVVVLAAVSACLEAALDATTIIARVSGGAVTGRSLWIGSFVVSIVTVVVAGPGWGRRDPATNAMRWSYGLAALLNLAVPAVFAVRPGGGIVLPLLHLVTAMVLAGLVLARGPGAPAPDESRHQLSGDRSPDEGPSALPGAAVLRIGLLSALREVPLASLLCQREEIQLRLTGMMDATTEPWGLKVTLVEVKDVELPESMRRSMAKEAEAERECPVAVIRGA